MNKIYSFLVDAVSEITKSLSTQFHLLMVLFQLQRDALCENDRFLSHKEVSNPTNDSDIHQETTMVEYWFSISHLEKLFVDCQFPQNHYCDWRRNQDWVLTKFCTILKNHHFSHQNIIFDFDIPDLWNSQIVVSTMFCWSDPETNRVNLFSFTESTIICEDWW